MKFLLALLLFSESYHVYAACPAVDVSGQIIVPADVVEQEGLFCQSSNHVNVNMPLSVPDSTSTDGQVVFLF